MSYHTWHEYGYGIIVNNIYKMEDLNIDRVFDLVHKAPNFEKHFLEWAEYYKHYYGLNAIGISDIDNYEDDMCYKGIGPIMQEVIKEADGIDFYVCDDFDCKQYLMFSAGYPWYMTDKEKSLTEKDIDDVLSKYIKILTDEPIKIEYLSCENGG